MRISRAAMLQALRASARAISDRQLVVPEVATVSELDRPATTPTATPNERPSVVICDYGGPDVLSPVPIATLNERQLIPPNVAEFELGLPATTPAATLNERVLIPFNVRVSTITVSGEEKVITTVLKPTLRTNFYGRDDSDGETQAVSVSCLGLVCSGGTPITATAPVTVTPQAIYPNTTTTWVNVITAPTRTCTPTPTRPASQLPLFRDAPEDDDASPEELEVEEEQPKEGTSVVPLDANDIPADALFPNRGAPMTTIDGAPEPSTASTMNSTQIVPAAAQGTGDVLFRNQTAHLPTRPTNGSLANLTQATDVPNQKDKVRLPFRGGPS